MVILHGREQNRNTLRVGEEGQRPGHDPSAHSIEVVGHWAMRYKILCHWLQCHSVLGLLLVSLLGRCYILLATL